MNGASRAKPKSGKAKSASARKAAVAEKADSSPSRPLWRRPIRLATIILLILLAIPVLLIPVYLVVNPVGTTIIASRLAGPVSRDWVDFDSISKHLVVSVMVSEDARFCEHGGVDWRAIREVVDDPDGPARGASTIPMQTVRNLFLWQARSYVRKAIEIPLALYADLIWSKRRAMEIYLNIAEWGPSIFGIEAAAGHYFGRSAKDLTARQSALLAVTLPNPIARDPARPTAAMLSRARTIEARARAAGPYIVCLYP